MCQILEFSLPDYVGYVMPFLKHAEQKVYLYLYQRYIEQKSVVCVSVTELVHGRRAPNGLVIDFGAQVSRPSAISALSVLEEAGLIENIETKRTGTTWYVETDFTRIDYEILMPRYEQWLKKFTTGGKKTLPLEVKKNYQQWLKNFTASGKKTLPQRDPTLYIRSLRGGNKTREAPVKNFTASGKKTLPQRDPTLYPISLRGENKTRETPIKNFTSNVELENQDPAPAPPLPVSNFKNHQIHQEMLAFLEALKTYDQDHQAGLALVDFLLAAFGKTALASQDTPTGQRTLGCIRETALNLLGMGYDSLEAIQALMTRWRKEHWAGQRNGTPSQFLEFASSQKQNASLDDAETDQAEPIIARSQNSYWPGLFPGGQA